MRKRANGQPLITPLRRTVTDIVRDAEMTAFLSARGWTQWHACTEYWQLDDGPLLSLPEAYWQEAFRP